MLSDRDVSFDCVMEKARISIPYPLEAHTKSAGVGGPPRARCVHGSMDTQAGAEMGREADSCSPG